MIDALATIGDETNSPDQGRVLLCQAEAILRRAEKSVSEPNDRDDIQAGYRRLIHTASPIETASSPVPSGAMT
jgi:uncharacterized membrane protein